MSRRDDDRRRDDRGGGRDDRDRRDDRGGSRDYDRRDDDRRDDRRGGSRDYDRRDDRRDDRRGRDDRDGGYERRDDRGGGGGYRDSRGPPPREGGGGGGYRGGRDMGGPPRGGGFRGGRGRGGGGGGAAPLGDGFEIYSTVSSAAYVPMAPLQRGPRPVGPQRVQEILAELPKRPAGDEGAGAQVKCVTNTFALSTKPAGTEVTLQEYIIKFEPEITLEAPGGGRDKHHDNIGEPTEDELDMRTAQMAQRVRDEKHAAVLSKERSIRDALGVACILINISGDKFTCLYNPEAPEDGIVFDQEQGPRNPDPLAPRAPRLPRLKPMAFRKPRTMTIKPGRKCDIDFAAGALSFEQRNFIDLVIKEVQVKAGYSRIGASFFYREDESSLIRTRGIAAFENVAENLQGATLLRGFEAVTRGGTLTPYVQVSLIHTLLIKADMNTYLQAYVSYFQAQSQERFGRPMTKEDAASNLLKSLKGQDIIPSFVNQFSKRFDKYRIVGMKWMSLDNDMDSDEMKAKEKENFEKRQQRRIAAGEEPRPVKEQTYKTFRQHFSKKLGPDFDLGPDEQWFVSCFPRVSSKKYRYPCNYPGHICRKIGLDEEFKKSCMQEISSHSRMAPEKKQEYVKGFVSTCWNKQDARSHLERFKMSMSCDPMISTGRVLAVKQDDRIDQSVVDKNEAVNLAHCAVIHPRFNNPRDKELVETYFRDQMQQQAQRSRVPCKDKLNLIELPLDNWQGGIEQSAIEQLKSQMDGDIKCVFIVLPKGSKQMKDKGYCTTKAAFLSYATGGASNADHIESQCVRFETIEKAQEEGLRKGGRGVAPPMSGVFRGARLKLGGSNFRRNWSSEKSNKTMVIGIDFTMQKKRGPNGKDIATVAIGMVASISTDFISTYHNVMFTEGASEIASRLDVFTQEALEEYKKLNDVFPQHIVVYRAGIDDGGKANAKELEVTQIEGGIDKACGSDVPPTLTFVVVTKRGALKIYEIQGPEGPEPAEGQSRKLQIDNCKPLTVVNSNVVNPNNWEFHIVHAAPPRGTTATPTTYHVIHTKEDVWGSAELEDFTGYMSLMYQNWERGPIRLPSMLMCAWRLVTTASVYLPWGEEKPLALRYLPGFY